MEEIQSMRSYISSYGSYKMPFKIHQTSLSPTSLERLPSKLRLSCRSCSKKTLVLLLPPLQSLKVSHADLYTMCLLEPSFADIRTPAYVHSRKVVSKQLQLKLITTLLLVPQKGNAVCVHHAGLCVCREWSEHHCQVPHQQQADDAATAGCSIPPHPPGAVPGVAACMPTPQAVCQQATH